MWKLRGAVGRLHYPVVYIRKTPQRRQEFAAGGTDCDPTPPRIRPQFEQIVALLVYDHHPTMQLRMFKVFDLQAAVATHSFEMVVAHMLQILLFRGVR